MPVLMTGDAQMASEFLRRRMERNRPERPSPFEGAAEDTWSPEVSPLWERAEQQLMDIMEGKGPEQTPEEAERLWMMQHAPAAYGAELREKSVKELKELAAEQRQAEKKEVREFNAFRQAEKFYETSRKEYFKALQKGEYGGQIMEGLREQANAAARAVKTAGAAESLGYPNLEETYPEFAKGGRPKFIIAAEKRIAEENRRIRKERAEKLKTSAIFEMPEPSPFGGREIPGMEEAMQLAATEAALQAHPDKKAVAKAVAEIKAAGNTVPKRVAAAPAVLEKHGIPPAAEAPTVPAGLHRLMEEGVDYGAEAVSPFGEGFEPEVRPPEEDYGAMLRRIIDQGRAEPEFARSLRPFEGAGQRARPGEQALSRVPELMQRYRDRMAAMEVM